MLTHPFKKMLFATINVYLISCFVIGGGAFAVVVVYILMELWVVDFGPDLVVLILTHGSVHGDHSWQCSGIIQAIRDWTP